MIKIQSFTFNPFQENTYLVWDETLECVIIDAGCYDKSEQEELTSFIKDHKLQPKYLLSTHSHIDHVLGNYFLKQHYQIPLVIHPDDEATLRAVKTYAAVYGFPQFQEQLPDSFISEGQQIAFGNTVFEVLFVPGHAPGHIAFYKKNQNICFSGDVLFAGSIGRTDLPGGKFDTLISSIQNKLYPLGDELSIFPGHGPETNLGYERKYNPYLRD